MNKLWQLIIYRIMHFGTIPLCNGIASRAPRLGTFCFPLCYRCTFILLFTFLTLLYRKNKMLSLKWIIVLLCPMVIDGMLQTFFHIMSTNVRRSLTGALFGIALGYILKRVYFYIDKEKPVV